MGEAEGCLHWEKGEGGVVEQRLKSVRAESVRASPKSLGGEHLFYPPSHYCQRKRTRSNK